MFGQTRHTATYCDHLIVATWSGVPRVDGYWQSPCNETFFLEQFVGITRTYYGKSVGRDSSVGIATRYGLDGPGIESRWGARFSAPVQTGPGPHPASYTVGTRSLSRVKAAVTLHRPPTPPSSEVKEWVELYLYYPFGASWPILGLPLPLYQV